MRLLLDTHAAVWLLTDRTLIAAGVRDIIDDPNNVSHVSAVAVWEIAIKNAAARRQPFPFSATASITYFEEAGLVMLPITPLHAAAVETLPGFHADPFDRLLIAQALTEPMRLVSQDRQVAAYSDTVITW